MDDRVGVITNFIEHGVPRNYDTISLDAYRNWWEEGGADPVPRETVCRLEIHTVLFGRPKDTCDVKEQRSLGNCLRSIPGWEESKNRPYTRFFGRQRVYRRVLS